MTQNNDWGQNRYLSNDTITVYGRAPNANEVYMGTGQGSSRSQNLANTSNQHSTSHRQAWEIYPDVATFGVLQSYYMSGSGHQGPWHSIIDIRQGYTVSGETWKMCIWVR